MAEDKTTLTLDADDLLRELDKAFRGWRQYGEVVEHTTKITERAISGMKRTVKVTDVLVDSGRKLTVIQKETSDGWKQFSSSIKSVAASEKELTAAQQKRAMYARQTRETRDFAAGEVTTPAKGSTATQKEQVAATQAIAKLNGVIDSQKVKVGELKTIWSQVSRGEIQQYDTRLTKVQQAVLKVNETQRALGQTAIKNNALLAKQAEVAKRAADVAEKEAQQAAIEQQKLNAERERAIRINQRVAQSQQAIRNRTSNIDTTTATAAEKNRYAQANAALLNFVKNNQVSAKVVKRVWSQVDKGAFANYTGRLGQLQSHIQAVNTATAKLGKTQERVNKGAKGFLLSWSSIGRMVVGNVIHRSIYAVSAALIQGVKDAVKYRQAIAEIQTISQDSARTADEWFRSAKALSTAFGTDIASQLEATYQSLSNQVAKGSEVTSFLAEANTLAITATASTEQSVNALSSVINAYGLEASDAADISAKLFKGIELGRFRLGQIANTMGNVTVLASQVGISIDEMVAALATLTRQGVPAAAAMTQIRGIMQKLISPSEEMSKFLKSIGFESGRAAVEALGFAGVLQRMETYADGSLTVLNKLVPRMRGFTGTVGLTGKGLNEYRDSLEKVQSAEASYAQAQEKALDNAAQNSRAAYQAISNYFKDLGSSLLEDGNTILDFYFDFSGKMEQERDRLARTLNLESEVKKQTEGFRKQLHEQVKLQQQAAAEQRKALNQRVDDSAYAYKAIADLANTHAKASVKSWQDAIKGTEAGIKSLENTVKRVDAELIALDERRRKTAFTEAQRGRDAAGQVRAIAQEVAYLENQQAEAAKKLDADRYIGLQRQIEELGKQRLEIEHKTQDDAKKQVRERAKLEADLIEAQGKLQIKQQENLNRVRSGKKSVSVSSEVKKVDELKTKLEAVESVEVRRLSGLQAMNAQQDRFKLGLISIRKEAVKQEKIKQAELQTLRVQGALVEDSVKKLRAFDVTAIASKSPDEAIRGFANLSEALDKAKEDARRAGTTLDAIFGKDYESKLRQTIQKQTTLATAKAAIANNELKIKEEAKKVEDTLAANQKTLITDKKRDLQIDQRRLEIIERLLTLQFKVKNKVVLVAPGEEKRLGEIIQQLNEGVSARGLQGSLQEILTISRRDRAADNDVDVANVDALTDLVLLLKQREKSTKEVAKAEAAIAQSNKKVNDLKTANVQLGDVLRKNTEEQGKQLSNYEKLLVAAAKVIKANTAQAPGPAKASGPAEDTIPAFSEITKLTDQAFTFDDAVAVLKAANILGEGLLTKDLKLQESREKGVETIRQAGNAIAESGQSTELVKEAIKKSADEADSLKSGVDGVATAVDGVTSKVDTVTEAWKKHQEEVRKTILLLDEWARKEAATGKNGQSTEPSEPDVNHARGKMIGRDNVQAYIRSDEAVMNSAATRRYYSQLSAMNATPQSLRTPGTTIGSLNVQMQASGELNYDALALGKEIKKLTVRGLL